MKQFDAWWFPDAETHLINWMSHANRVEDGRLTYQYEKYAAVRQLCNSTRWAIDVGAHVGLWSYWMARDFNHVEAFEPVLDHVNCWLRNMEEWKNAVMHPVALGAREQTAYYRNRSPGCTGAVEITDFGRGVIQGTTPMLPLDSFDLIDVDLLKIDCEGYELEVLNGAKDTIRRSTPVVCIEQKKTREAIEWLIARGYQHVLEINGDHLMKVPD